MVARRFDIARRTLACRIRLAATAALLTCLPGGHPFAGQQRSDTQQRPPTFRTEANFIEVDVTVTDGNGAFVRGLGRDDFEILEDGKAQTVSAFAVVDLPYEVRSATSASASPRATQIEPDVRSNELESESRVFVLVLDDLHTNALRSGRVKEVAREFIERYVGPRDLVSVIHTSGRSDASQEFTSAPSLVLKSIDKFTGRKLRSRVLEQLDSYNVQADGREPTGGTGPDQRLQRIADPLDAERGRQTETMLQMLERLGSLLADTRGRRKSVVLFSEGVDYDLASGISQTSSGLSQFISPSAASVVRRLRDAISAMTRANVAVYSVDPRGLATTGDDQIEMGALPQSPLLGITPTALQDELRQAQDSLRVLSDETGGFAAINSNDFSRAFERIVQENSTYYLLAYRTANTRTDGRFRRIDVRVKRPGLQVRARKGYYAPSSRDAGTGLMTLTADTEPSQALRQLLDNALPVNGMPLKAFAAPFKGSGSISSVLFGLELGAQDFTFGRKDGLYTDKLEAAVIAIDYQGKALKGERHSVDLALRPETYESVRANGMRLLFRLNLPPGRYQLRAAAQESGAGAAGSVHYDVEIPDFDRQPLSLSGVVLTSDSASAIATPYADEELQPVLGRPPSASRAFSSRETAAAMFALYHNARNATGPVDIVTTVAAPDGQVRFRNEIQVPAERMAEAQNGAAYVVKIPLVDLAPGAYVLRVQATSRLARDAATARDLSFVIENPGGTAR
jgi:VWFA-related protein